jgi:DNA-directed RNA polymerase specialized sigma24 family protein
VAERPNILDAFFDAEPESARKQVAMLRSKLIKYFAWHHCACPEELVSETVFRALGRISSGCEVPNLASFCHGIAVNVLREEWKKKTEVELDDNLVDVDTVFSGKLNRQERARLAEECLQIVSAEDRAILREYFWEDRAAFALRLDISSTALRIRILRILKKIRARVGGKGFAC